MTYSATEIVLPVLAAFTAYVAYKAYGLFGVPKDIKDLPAIPLFTTVKYLLEGTPFDEREFRTFRDIVIKEGLARKWQRGSWIVSVADPNYIKQLLSRTDLFPKALGEMDIIKGQKTSAAARFFGGDSINFSNGEVWKRQRMVANPAFKRAVGTKDFGILTKKIFKEFAKEGLDVDWRNMMQRITLDSMGKYVFGSYFQAVENEFSCYAEAYNCLMEGIADPKFIIFPFLEKMTYLFPERPKVYKSLDIIHGLFEDAITKKRAAYKTPEYKLKPYAEKDILELMIEAEDTENATMTFQEMKDNLCVFFVAGHDTTTTVLSVAGYYLAKYKHIQDKARQEIIDLIGDEPMDIVPSFEDTKHMPYLTMVVREAMRMIPPVAELPPRIATVPIQFGDRVIPPGSLVSPDVFCLMHNPKIWGDDVDEFIPERHSPERLNAMSNAAWSWMPFGAGARLCVGLNFAWTEIKTVLPMMLRKYEFHLPKDSIHADKVHLQPGDFPLMIPINLRLNFTERYPST